MPDITAANILIIATHGVEQSELEVPRDRLREAGATVTVAAPDAAAIKGWHNREWGKLIPVDMALDEVDVADYDALILPGGVMNPDRLRQNEQAVSIVRDFIDDGRVVAAICHAPWLLAEADVLDGREVTSYPSLKTDLENAGAFWRDKEVVVDDGLITSRTPRDLDAFVAAIIEEIAKGNAIPTEDHAGSPLR